MKFPEIKKKVNSFLLDEEGKISKKNMIITGAVLSAAAFSLIQNAKLVSASKQHRTVHDNSLNFGENVNEAGEHIGVKGTHGHHLSHASHDVHAQSSSSGSYY